MTINRNCLFILKSLIDSHKAMCTWVYILDVGSNQGVKHLLVSNVKQHQVAFVPFWH